MSFPRFRSFGRITILVVLGLLLLIPLFMVRNMVSERQGRSVQVHNEIAGKWGGKQVLGAPILSVPLTLRVPKKGGVVEVQEQWVRLFPESLSIDAELETQIRKRSLFEVPVYTASIDLKGFWDPRKVVLPDPAWVAEWSRAVVSVDAGDARSLTRAPGLQLGGSNAPLDNAQRSGTVRSYQLHASAGPTLSATAPLSFRVQVVQRGTDRIAFAPEASSTQVRVRSDWKSPSFQGSFLPDGSQISASGFDASWSVSGLNLGTPLVWVDGDAPAAQDVDDTYSTEYADSEGRSRPRVPVLAVSLVEPVDGYDSVDRSLKYGILVIALAFLALFLFEAFLDSPLHPVQYGMIGLALVFFYLLLLSISEHLGFDMAYTIAATAVTGLVAGYASAALAGWKRGLALGLGLVTLWSFLYTLLKAEDWSLLMGSTGLFLILAITMWLTRRIDWNRRDQTEADDA